MARRRSNRSFSGGFEPPFGLPPFNALLQLRALAKSLEDRRRFHPLGALRPVAAVSRSARRLRITPKRAGFFPEPGLSFSVPREVALCVRRKERREVIFAKRKGGKGARSRRRRNRWSDVRC